MNLRLDPKLILRITGFITIINGIAMIPSTVISAIYNEHDMLVSFLLLLVPLIIFGIFLIVKTETREKVLSIREGILIVATCWVLTSLIGAIPYMFSGVFTSYIDALFESVSGFTTTGATLIEDLNAVPKGLLFWRSLSHWIGGMGILVFAISVLPALGIGAQNLAKAETPGPSLDKMSTRIADNSKMLYFIYGLLTIMEFILLLTGGLSPYDSIIHTFGSISTGGLSNYPEGVMHFDSMYISMIFAIFCILSSLNFVAYKSILSGHPMKFFKTPEIKAFFIILGGAFLIITFVRIINGSNESIGDTLFHSFFQTTMFMTTTGYSSTDYSMWPVVCKWVLFILLFIGGCSASTSGGLKVIRVATMFKLIKRSLFKRIHPNAVVAVKLGNKPIAAETVSNITVFIVVYFISFFAGCAILALDGQDISTTVSGVASLLSNTGIGFGKIASGDTFNCFSSPARLFLSFIMITGRLEIFTILMLLTPSFWRPNR